MTLEELAGSAYARRLGIYYTPDEIAAAAIEWAVPTRRGRVLDPSFGGCSFLRAALALGGGDATESDVSVFGVDVDDGAHEHARELHDMGVPTTNLVLADFFSIEPDRFGPPFDAVVGNPPYIRHHWHQGEQRRMARTRAEEAGVELAGRADTWAYFVVHSMRFLAPGGRLLLLLPVAALNADYAQPVWDHLCDQFASVRLVEMSDRLFAGAAEASVVLAADHYMEAASATVLLSRASNARELRETLADDAGVRVKTEDRNSWSLAELSNSAQDAWRLAVAHADVHPLGELATIRIGVVTGANRFFVRGKRDVEPLSQACLTTRPVISRAVDLRAARLTTADVEALSEAERPVNLLCISPNGRLPSGALLKEIARAEEEGVHERYHCVRRDPWYALSEADVPVAFLPYMGTRPPRPVLNDTRATCTNAIHRLWWKSGEVSPEAIVAGAWTSLYALGAEVYGRRYGGGVLKLEPSEAAKVPVPLADAPTEVLDRLDELVRACCFDEATELADRHVLIEGLGVSPADVARLRDAAASLKSHRSRRGRPDG